MSSPSRMDLFRGAGQVVQTGLQLWGVSQEQRRAAEYSKAVADAREGYRVLLEDIEKENDYTQHQVMFERGISEIRKTVGDQWLGDAAVRNRFDLQWEGMTQSAREAAMSYSWAAEKTALQIEMFNQIKDFYQSSLENAHANTRGLLSEYYETGIIDDRVREEAWSYYRQQGQHALKARVDAAVEVRDTERVEQLYETAIAGGILEDPELAANMKAADLYAIQVGTTEDIALGVYQEHGIDAAVAWLTDPKNETMGALELEDQARITRFVREQIGFRRSEEELAARKRNDAWDEQAIAKEAEMHDGQVSWKQGLHWLRTDEAQEAFFPATWRMYHDRWTIKDMDLEGRSGGVDPLIGQQTFADYMTRIRGGEGWESIMDDSLIDVHNGLINESDWERIQKYNFDRELLTQDASGFRAMIADVVTSQKASGSGFEITDYQIDQIEDDLVRNLDSLRWAPDGTEYTRAEQEAHQRSFIQARLRGMELERGAWFWTRDISDDALLEAAQQRKLYGLIDEQTMAAAMSAMQNTDMTDEERSAYLREQMFPGSQDHELWPLELNQRDAFEQMAELNARNQGRFTEDFQEEPASIGVTPDGIAYFTRIETEPDGARVERAYQLQIHDGNYQWRQYNRVGDRDVWAPFDPVKEREEAEAAEARRAAFRESRAAQAAVVAAAQPDIDPEKIGTQADGTAYENAAIDTAAGQPADNPVHHATILLLAQPMTDLADIQLSNKDRGVYDRVHSALTKPNAAIADSDFNEIMKIIEHYMPDWRASLEDRARPARDFREQLLPGGNQ